MYILLSEKLLPDEELVRVCEKQFALNDLIFDGNPPISWGTAKRHIMLAAAFARLKKSSQKYDQLKAAAKAARAFDERADSHISTLLLGKFTQKKTDYETADSRTLCKIMLDKWLAAEEFNDFRNTPEFLEVIKSLY